MNHINKRLAILFYKNMRNILINACKEIKVDGFKVIERRNLTESKDYNLNQVNSYIPFIYNLYKEFIQIFNK